MGMINPTKLVAGAIKAYMDNMKKNFCSIDSCVVIKVKLQSPRIEV